MRFRLKSIALSILISFSTSFPLFSEVFRFQFKDGDTYRINSMVSEEVFFNRLFSHQADITNRVTVEVSDVRKQSKTAPASALYTCTFMTSEKNSRQSFSWGRQYPSIFRRDEFGFYTIDTQYFMPVVRDVPIFPAHDVKIGESWVHHGTEAHDLRDTFGIQRPFVVPFEVVYTYKGRVKKDGKSYHLIEASYDLYSEIPIKNVLNTAGSKHSLPSLFPVRTMGYSKQNLYWDNETGILPIYDEVFAIQMELNTGAVVEYRGSARAEITALKRMDKDEITAKINKSLRELGITNAFVQKTDEGVMITLENIQFASDSAQLQLSEKQKLEKIGKLLIEYPEYELLISGHTALAGQMDERLLLSEQRAAAVAGYLTELGIREAHHIYTRGFGSSRPIAPNTDEKNMARNRRVEITVLEK